MAREASVQRQSRLELQARGAKHVKGNPTLGAGCPDLLACHRGVFVVAELKKAGENPTRLQEHELEQWRRAGAVTGVVRSRGDMARLLDAAEAIAEIRSQTYTGRR